MDQPHYVNYYMIVIEKSYHRKIRYRQRVQFASTGWNDYYNSLGGEHDGNCGNIALGGVGAGGGGGIHCI